MSVFNPGGWLAWLVIGLLAGAIAGRIVRGRGYGCLLDIFIGVLGAFIGGVVVSLFVPQNTYGFIGTLIVATLGAIVLLAFVRLLSPSHR